MYKLLKIFKEQSEISTRELNALAEDVEHADCETLSSFKKREDAIVPATLVKG